jgi:hypothetical protein
MSNPTELPLTHPLGAPPPSAVPVNPCRRPSWRYDIAAAAALNRRLLLRRQYDRETCRLADYLSRELRCRTAAECAHVAKQAPHIAVALAIWREVNRAVAALLEAHLLSRRDLKEVAERTALSRRTVRTYQHYFFSFGPQFNCWPYVLEQTIAGELSSGLPPATAERYATLKFIAYRSGPDALDRALSTPTQAGELWQRASDAFSHLQEMSDLRSLLAAELRGGALGGRHSPAEIIEGLETSNLNETATNILGRNYD